MSDATAAQGFEAPYFVVIDYEQGVSDHETLQDARDAGRRACDAEPLPCTFSIQDANGNHVEDIPRSDGASLADRIAVFSAALHGR
jgi:hypothetical protein